MENKRYELKELTILTNFGSFCIDAFVRADTMPAMPDIPDSIVVREIINIMIKKNLLDWTLVFWDKSWSKELSYLERIEPLTEEEKENSRAAGWFWLKLDIKLKKEL